MLFVLSNMSTACHNENLVNGSSLLSPFPHWHSLKSCGKRLSQNGQEGNLPAFQFVNRSLVSEDQETMCNLSF